MTFWAVEPVIKLLQCVASGKSAKDTAGILSAEYGHVSRNACISKAKREHVIFHGDPWKHQRGEARRAPKPPKLRLVAAKRTKSTPKPPTPPRSISQIDHDIPTEQRKSLLDLTNETCRFPIGDPQETGFFFCGAPEADVLNRHPYCARHTRITTNRQRSLDLSDAERERRRRWGFKLAGLGAA